MSKPEMNVLVRNLSLEQCFKWYIAIFGQVFQEAATYRGTLKTLGRIVVRAKYADALDPEFEVGNQEELFDIIRKEFILKVAAMRM